jgi:hypothetical protein
VTRRTAGLRRFPSGIEQAALGQTHQDRVERSRFQPRLSAQVVPVAPNRGLLEQRLKDPERLRRNADVRRLLHEHNSTYVELICQVASFRRETSTLSPSTARELWNAVVEGYRSFTCNFLGLALGLLRYGPNIVLWLEIVLFPARLVWRRLRA